MDASVGGTKHLRVGSYTDERSRGREEQKEHHAKSKNNPNNHGGERS